MEKSSSLSAPLPPSNKAELWKRMEEAAREIIEKVHPTVVSEDRRRDVIAYMQRFIRTAVGCEVHSFGSVPLKTYLPEGDIDLTAFGGPCLDGDLAHKVFFVLEREKKNVNAEFIIKDVKLTSADVKVVTCLVQNMVIDISFNQLGGISTLCFLEKVDNLIGKDHLFKRSIILIKAWCFYESHILGAVHGLISTYALETLVLYIFHLFHSSLDGPLAVLYKFLDYYSKFDWGKYCISLNGPICRSSLPKIVVETQENGGQDVLLTSEFLKECLEKYTVPSLGFETSPRVFQPKYLNVVDPLKGDNNLGRSVNKANFNRVRAAFTFGARTLGKIILLSEEEDITFELREFFSNMLCRHGRRNVLGAVPIVDNVISPANHVQEGQMVHESGSSGASGAAGNGRQDQEHLLHAGASSTNGLELKGLPGDKESVSPLSGKDGIENGSVHNTSLMNPATKPQEEMMVAATPNVLSDLTGDSDTQLKSLQFGRWWLDFVENGPPMPPLLAYLPNNNSWELFPPAPPFNWNSPGLINTNGPVPRHVFHMNPPMIPNPNSGVKELTKPRGTGTYLPNANNQMDKPFSTRRKSRRNNGRERYHHPNQTNEAINHSNVAPLPAKVRNPPEGRKQTDITTTSAPSSKQEDRVTGRESYHLTDAQEFPPL